MYALKVLWMGGGVDTACQGGLGAWGWGCGGCSIVVLGIGEELVKELMLMWLGREGV